MAKDKKLRVVVIGCGAIAQRRHLPEYKARPDVQIVAVVDKNRQRAKQVAGEFGAGEFFTDYRDALALKPDAASICTPTAFHAPYSIAFLRAGAHVLCEKPMAAGLREGKAMVAAASAARRQLMIGHNQRLHVAHVRGKKVLASGILGKPISFTTTFAHGGPETWSVDLLKCHFFRRGEAIWGSMADLGVHKIDLMRWLLDDDFVEVTAMFDTLVKKKCSVEDTAYAVLRTSRGVMGQMFAGWAHQPGCDNSTRIYCEKGILRLEDDPQFTVVAELASGERHCIRTQGIQTNEKGGQFSSGVIDGFVDAVLTGRPNPIPGTSILNSLATVVACVESGRTGRFVRVPKV
ncbi:MAG: Gfo/Idh/MocA family protein [Phycisphaerae bacterium]